MLSKLLLVLASVVVMVSSQWSATIDPNSVSLPLRREFFIHRYHHTLLTLNRDLVL
jgi:hypothetical protein